MKYLQVRVPQSDASNKFLYKEVPNEVVSKTEPTEFKPYEFKLRTTTSPPTASDEESEAAFIALELDKISDELADINDGAKEIRNVPIVTVEDGVEKIKNIPVTVIEIPDGTNPRTVGFGKNTQINTANNYSAWVNGGLADTTGKKWVGAVVSYGDNVGKIKPKPTDAGGNFDYSNETLDWGGEKGAFNGVMGLTANKELVLFQYGDPRIQTTDFYWAFQNGMMLLKDGVNPHNDESTNEVIRSGIGFKEDGSLVYIKTDEPVTFHAFSELFKTMGAKTAIYLDGGVETYNGFGTSKKTDGVSSERPIIQFFDPSGQGVDNVFTRSKTVRVETNN